MVAEIALVTANFGGIDPVFPLPPHPGIEAIYFSDQQVPPSAGWTAAVPRTTSSPMISAKRIKCQIHRLDEVWGSRWLAWADASFEFRSLQFLTQWTRRANSQGASAVFVPHPDRKTVADEYAYVLRLLDEGSAYLTARYESEPLRRERAHFSEHHNLSTLPMWCGGLWIVRNEPRIHEFLDHWWATVTAYSPLDQAAISPLLVEHGLKAISANVDIYQSEHWTRHPHP